MNVKERALAQALVASDVAAEFERLALTHGENCDEQFSIDLVAGLHNDIVECCNFDPRTLTEDEFKSWIDENVRAKTLGYSDIINVWSQGWVKESPEILRDSGSIIEAMDTCIWVSVRTELPDYWECYSLAVATFAGACAAAWDEVA